MERLPAKEKAKELYLSFIDLVHSEDGKGGRINMVESATKVIDEVIESFMVYKIFGEVDYWNDVKRELQNFIK